MGPLNKFWGKSCLRRGGLLLAVWLSLSLAMVAAHDESGDAEFVELQRLGRGVIHQIALSPGGERLAVASATGVWIYSFPALEDVAHFSTPDYAQPDHTREDLLVSGGVVDVKIVAWSPDGRYLASGGNDGVLRVWDTEQGELWREFAEYKEDYFDEIRLLAWSPDGHRIAFSVTYHTVLLLDSHSGNLLAKLEHPHGQVEYVSKLVWSPDGRHIATIRDVHMSGSRRSYVHIWNAQSGVELKTIRQGKFAISLAWLPDGERLAIGGFNDPIQIWDVVVGNNQPLMILDQFIISVIVSPDGQHLASGGEDGRITLRDVDTGKVLLDYFGHRLDISSLSFSPDGARLASASNVRWIFVGEQPENNFLRIWDLENEELFWEKELYGGTRDIIWSLDGQYLAYADDDNYSIQVLDAVSGITHALREDHTPKVGNIVWLAGGQELLTIGRWFLEEVGVRVWDIERGEVLREFGQTIDQIALSPDQQWLATISYDDNYVRIWDIASGDLIREMGGGIKRHIEPITSLSWSPDGAHLATTSWDETVRIWDVASGEVKVVLAGHNAAVRHAAWSPDGRYLASIDENTGLESLRRWDTKTWQEVEVREEEISRDSRLNDNESYDEVRWLPGSLHLGQLTGDQILLLVIDEPNAVSPNRQWVASAIIGAHSFHMGLFEPDVRRRDSYPFSDPSYYNHGNWIHTLAWSPDSQYLATGGEDGVVRIWGWREGE